MTFGLTYRRLPDLLLGELVAAADLADLVALVVPARGAVAAVIFPLATDALSTSLPLLFGAFFLLMARLNQSFQTP